MIDNPRILVALDFDDLNSCLALVNKLDPSLCRLKVGKELFTAYGPSVVERLREKGFDIFLDLKFHDIPTTVAKALKAVSNLGVWMVNVHASGGARMLDAASEALANAAERPLLIAVTVLTSMESSDLAAVGVVDEALVQAKRLARLAHQSGLDGVVCSAHEVETIKQSCHSDFLCVTPGIRPLSAAVGDQRRVMTPSQAVSKGSDYLVIGRPVTQADDPRLVLTNIAKEIDAVGRDL